MSNYLIDGIAFTDADVCECANLQYTDLSGNNNKFWRSWFLNNGTECSEWGRVGNTPAQGHWNSSPSMWHGKVNEKRRKGYNDVATVAVVNTTGVSPAKIKLGGLLGQFVDWAGVVASQHIKQYLQGDVNNLAPEQIDIGRRHLNALMNTSRTSLMFVALLEQYYRAIPTILPSRIDADQLAKTFDFNEQGDRLNQLEAAVSITRSAGNIALPFELKEASTPVENAIMDAARKTGAKYAKVRAVFTVDAPDKARYDGCGIGNEMNLFHGTKQHAVQHILRQGLRCASAPAGLMFGAGIYLADAWEKSHNYTSGNDGQAIFVCRAKLGKQHLAQDEIKGIRKAPTGFDSVFGKKGYTKAWGSYSQTLVNSEFVVYDPAQVRLAAVVWYR